MPQLLDHIVVTLLDNLQYFLYLLFRGFYNDLLRCLRPAGSPMISLPLVTYGSATGVITGIETGTVVDVLIDGMTTDLWIVGGEISGEKSLPLLVTLLASTILLTSVSTSSFLKSCLIPW